MRAARLRPREITFEAQAMWLEHLARASAAVAPYPFLFENGELDYRLLLAQIAADRVAGRSAAECARAFHAAVARGMLSIVRVCVGQAAIAAFR